MSPLPVLTNSGERLYDALEPFQEPDADPAVDYQLAEFLSALAAAYNEVGDLIADQDDDTPGYAEMFDPAQCPDWLLPWAAQFVGVSMPAGLSVDQQRIRYAQTGGFQRGTPDAIVGAARQFLMGVKEPINRVTNPSYEQNLSGWTAFASGSPTFVVQRVLDPLAPSGQYSAEVAASALAAAGNFVFYQGGVTSPQSVAAGQTVGLRGFGKVMSGSVSLLRLVARFYDTTGAYLSEVAATGTGSISSPTVGQPYEMYGTVTAPTNAGFVDLEYRVDLASGTAATARFDGGLVVVNPVGGVVPAYFDGDSNGAHWAAVQGGSVSVTDDPTAQTTVYLNERQGDAYALGVSTIALETPDPTQVLRALLDEKPAGLVLTYATLTGGDWNTLEATHTDWNAVTTRDATWAAAIANPVQ